MKKNLSFLVFCCSFLCVQGMKKKSSLSLQEIKGYGHSQHSVRIKGDIFFRPKKFPSDNLLKIPQKNEDFAFTQIKPHHIQDEDITMDVESDELFSREEEKSPTKKRKDNCGKPLLKDQQEKVIKDIFFAHENKENDDTEDGEKTPCFSAGLVEKTYFFERETHIIHELSYTRNLFDENFHHDCNETQSPHGQNDSSKDRIQRNHQDNLELCSSIHQSQKYAASPLENLWGKKEDSPRFSKMSPSQAPRKDGTTFRRLSSCCLQHTKVFVPKKN